MSERVPFPYQPTSEGISWPLLLDVAERQGVKVYKADHNGELKQVTSVDEVQT